jgi:hypothetical protein
MLHPLPAIWPFAIGRDCRVAITLGLTAR